MYAQKKDIPSPLEVILIDLDHQDAIAFFVVQIAEDLIERKIELVN